MWPDAAPAGAVDRIVVLATGNDHKLREVSQMLGDAPFCLEGLRQYPEVILPPETGETFEANAASKALAAAAETRHVAIADDSGIEVDALGGEPGVHSARFSGPGATDRSNLELLLDRMKNVPDEQRTARYVCALAIADPEGGFEVVRLTWEGMILRAPRGSGGFGYDPVFRVAGTDRSAAELSPREKNELSHRGQAARAALPRIERRLTGRQAL